MYKYYVICIIELHKMVFVGHKNNLRFSMYVLYVVFLLYSVVKWRILICSMPVEWELKENVHTATTYFVGGFCMGIHPRRYNSDVALG